MGDVERRRKPALRSLCGGMDANLGWAASCLPRSLPDLSNLAAAAHYMLARFHVCAGKATIMQMKTVIDGYDAKKRIAINGGDKELKTIALAKESRPFPPDFAIKGWAVPRRN